MKFFVPHAADDAEAESVYRSIAKFVSAPAAHDRANRIAALSWQHNGKAMSCEVGKPLPAYYQTGDEPVLAIFECATYYAIATPSRGGVRGDPILASGNSDTRATRFSE